MQRTWDPGSKTTKAPEKVLVCDKVIRIEKKRVTLFAWQKAGGAEGGGGGGQKQTAKQCGRGAAETTIPTNKLGGGRQQKGVG